MNEVKVGKLPIIASYTCNFISKFLQGGQKYGGFLLNCTKIPLLSKNSTACFVLEVSTMSRFQNRICIASQEKENRIIYIS